jgi:hemerythrin superfamily protein
MAQTQSEKPPTPAQQTGPTPSERDPAGSKNEQNAGSDSDPIAMLRADHRRVEQLFGSFEKAGSAEQKSQLAKQICTELTVHTLIEEEIFYPACQAHIEQRLLEEAQVEHDGAKALIMEIRAGSPDDQYFQAKVKVLSEEIKHHVQEEEKPGTGIFAKAKEGGIATPELAKRLAERKQELMEEAKAGALGPPETRSFRVRTNVGMKPASQEHNMARGSSSTTERERDERGRFASDDDDRDYRRRSSGRSRYDDDDERRFMPRRDEEGRFTRSRSRYSDDDDDDRRGHGGWYGDPEGHSEASRRGWEERGGARARYRDDDDDRRYSRSRDEEGRFTSSRSRYAYDDDDNRRDSRAHGGWYGDAEGHSEASRRGWEERSGSRARYRDDDDDRRYSRSRDEGGRFTSSRSRYSGDDNDRRGSRGHGGWFGDPEGHSEASRRGWEERGSTRTRSRGDDDDDRRSSRSRYRDDDDDGRGGRRHGGWYGDPEGHSEAARRGRR